MISGLSARGVAAVFHYFPLHSAPTGVRYGRCQGNMHITNTLSECLVRLLLWVELTPRMQERVVAALNEVLPG